MKEKFTPRPYWKPEPKLHGMEFWALFVPALIYTIGVILFGGEAVVAGNISGATTGYGSWLMVIGGEIGTLASANEVFKKHRDGDATWLDWFGLFVSLIATLGTLFVVYTKLTPLTTAWVMPVRSWGPLALLLFSALDFYANVMELAFYRSHFGERWAKWNEQRHTDEMRQLREWQELAQPAKAGAQSAPPEPPVAKPGATTIDVWREICASANGDAPLLESLRRGGVTNKADCVNEILQRRGLAPVSGPTARRYAKMAKGSGE